MTPDKQQLKDELVKELKESNGAQVRESFAKLKDEIRKDIEKDKIKEEILEEIKTKSSKSDGFLKHPATLLVLGFLLTTILGTTLTSCWKSLELDNEREYLSTQTRCERERQTKSDEIKQKYEVKDEIIRRVAETNTAAEEILLYFQMKPARREREQNERVTYWKEATRNWRTNEKILKQRLLLRFSDPSVNQLFDDMITFRNWVGINIDSQQEALSSGGDICSERIKIANRCMTHIVEELMPQVIKLMNEEISSDEKALRAAQCVTGNNVSGVSGTASPQVASGNNSGKTSPDASVAPNSCSELLNVAKTCKAEADKATQNQSPTPNQSN